MSYRGSSTVNTLPSPFLLSALTLPPWASAIHFTMESPAGSGFVGFVEAVEDVRKIGIRNTYAVIPYLYNRSAVT